MSSGTSRGDELAMRLPLPLAQLYRRASNAKTALDRHHHAYYLAEATLKLAACARIGVALVSGLEPRSPLAQALEQLCLPSVGHWVGFLREAAESLRSRSDAALLPLAATNEALLRDEALPLVRAFAERAAADGGEGRAAIPAEEARNAARHGILGFFNLVAAYRNQVFGHGAQRIAAFYEELGPLLLDAACEVLERDCLFGGLTLAVARVAPVASGRELEVEWQGLKGLGSFTLARESVGPEPGAVRAAPGEVYFVGPGVRVPLHPLVVYQEDRAERERVGFLNRTLLRRDGEEVRRVEHLDYATGDLLSGIDAREALATLLARLRGRAATASDVDRLAQASQAEPQETDTTAPPGATLIGDFEIEGELGRGGMGIVYRARQRSLNRRVALKVLPPALAADPVALARFRREIAALARADHPSLVKILTSGSDGERQYYAMEILEGVNLAELFSRLAERRRESDRPLSEGHLLTPARGEGRAIHLRLAELFADAADAVAHLHARGILHRDLKPANLMLTADGQRLVVMDLGLAQVRDRSHSLTRTGTRWVGTLRYSAPEQLQWTLLDVDERADVYGLGASLYELVTLAPLFDGDTEPRLVEQVLHQEPKEPRSLDPTVPRDLAAIIAHCLDKDRTHRYANARDLAEDLRRFQGGLPVRVRPLGTARRLWRWCRRNRALAAASGLAVAALLAVAVVSSLLAVKERNNALGFQRRVAESDLARGQSLCEQGDIARGLHWMVRALGEAPADDEDLERAIRMNLGGWSRHLVSPRTVIQTPQASLSFSPDGKSVLTGSTLMQCARLWSAANGDPISPPLMHGGPVSIVAFSPDGDRVATGGEDGTARMWSAATGEPLGPPLGHEGPITALAFSPDGKLLLTASRDATARFWSVEAGRPAGRALQHAGPVNAAAFSRDGTRVLTGSDDGTARLWSVESREPIGPPLRHERGVNVVALSPDGQRVLTGSEDATARLWTAATGVAIGPPLQHRAPVRVVAFSPTGKWAATASSYDNSARLWSIETGTSHGLPLEHGGDILAIAFSPDGQRLATGSSDFTARIWSVETGEPIGEPLKHDNFVKQVAFSPKGDLLATAGEDHTVKLWPVGTIDSSSLSMKYEGVSWSIAFSPDGSTVATGCVDQSARLWSTVTGKQVGAPFEHPGMVWTVAFSPDGKLLLTGGGDKTARLWSAETQEPVGQPVQHQGAVLAVAFTPDGQRFLTGGRDNAVRFWSVKDGTPAGPILEHKNWVEDVAVSPDGRFVVTGCVDRSTRLWSLTTGRLLWSHWKHTRTVYSVAFSADGQRVATASEDKTARIWSIPTPVEGNVERVQLSTEAMTGLEMDAGGGILWLDPAALRERRGQLDAIGEEPSG